MQPEDEHSQRRLLQTYNPHNASKITQQMANRGAHASSPLFTSPAASSSTSPEPSSPSSSSISSPSSLETRHHARPATCQKMFPSTRNHEAKYHADRKSATKKFTNKQADTYFTNADLFTNTKIAEYSSNVPYASPPSPAPNDRFLLLPPPIDNYLTTPRAHSPKDRYPNTTFPSPCQSPPLTETFIPPPPLQSPRDSPYRQRHDVKPDDATSTYRKSFTKDGAYIAPSAHTPVERYVPQPNDSPDADKYHMERYLNNKTDPYMRRDLNQATPTQYRSHSIPQNYPPYFYQIRYSPNSMNPRCCPYDYYRCNATSVNRTTPSRVVLKTEPVTPEYVGASGGRLIALSTPSTSSAVLQSPSANEAMPSSGCMVFSSSGQFLSKTKMLEVSGSCSARSCSYDASGGMVATDLCSAGHVPICCIATMSRGQGIGHNRYAQQSPYGGATLRNINSWRSSFNHNGQYQSPDTPQRTLNRPNSNSSSSSSNDCRGAVAAPKEISPALATDTLSSSTFPSISSSSIESSPSIMNVTQPAPESEPTPTYLRTVSLPAPVRADDVERKTVNIQSNTTPSRASASGATKPRPALNRSVSERLPPRRWQTGSRSDVIKNFIRQETANFFCVDEETERDKSLRWLDRRKRFAARAYGDLKNEYSAGNDGAVVRQKQSRGYTSSGASPREARDDPRPDVLPTDDVTDAVQDSDVVNQNRAERLMRRKDSVAKMTLNAISYVMTTLTRQRGVNRGDAQPASRSYSPEEVELQAASSPNEIIADDDVFFSAAPQMNEDGPEVIDGLQTDTHDKLTQPTPVLRNQQYRRSSDDAEGFVTMQSEEENQFRQPNKTDHRWRASTRQWTAASDHGGRRVCPNVINHANDNSNRRKYGLNWISRFFGKNPVRKSVAQETHVREQLDNMEDHRPFFTWWVTTVQVLVLFVSLFCYGLGPFGFDLANRSGHVLVTSLSLQQVDILEPANFWIGPRAADLIHLGAKFSPCMRRDAKILKEIEKVREKERETACCIRNDDSGCVQSSEKECSKIISTWKKWSNGEHGPGGRTSGSVCGLDPKYCDAPASVAPYEWPDDITKWPICRKINGLMEQEREQRGYKINKKGASRYDMTDQRIKDKTAEHMVCEVIGHPCCIGIHGQCEITTRENCDFVNGYFHDEASLCSQVSCMDDVCGMMPFYFPESPDQFYRLWTSLFLHAGVIHLAISIVIQYTLMRDLEKLTGSFRIAIIYIGSGVAGNLASAIFVPYRAEVGPAGSQFGLLACLIVEVLNMWPMLRHPNRALLKLLTITGALFAIGVLPWIDNYAHVFGFVFGFLLSYAFLPFVSFGPYDREKKICLIWICLLSAAFLFTCLVLLFYFIPVYDCEVCSYFNCIPFTRNFCASQNINFKRRPIDVNHV